MFIFVSDSTLSLQLYFINCKVYYFLDKFFPLIYLQYVIFMFKLFFIGSTSQSYWKLFQQFFCFVFKLGFKLLIFNIIIDMVGFISTILILFKFPVFFNLSFCLLLNYLKIFKYFICLYLLVLFLVIALQISVYTLNLLALILYYFMKNENLCNYISSFLQNTLLIIVIHITSKYTQYFNSVIIFALILKYTFSILLGKDNILWLPRYLLFHLLFLYS